MMELGSLLTQPWVCCFVQVTAMLTIGAAVCHLAMKRIPAVAASTGVILMIASVGLVIMTLLGMPRPVQFVAESQSVVAPSVPSESNLASDAKLPELPVAFSGLTAPQ